MELTPNEKKLLAQLRKLETEMFRSRHLLLAVGISSLFAAGAGAILMLYWLSQTAEADRRPYTLLFAVVVLLAVHGAYLIGIVIRDWNGNAVRVLLLKVVDEKRKTDRDSRQQ
jgi:hypothetical protein